MIFGMNLYKKEKFLLKEFPSINPKQFDLDNPEFSQNNSLKENEFYLNAYPSIFLFDGRFANRGWLQEAPDPVSTIVWNNWVDINSEKAKELDIEDGDVIELESSSKKIIAPARVTKEVSKETAARTYN